MIIYNVTVKVNLEAHNSWFDWMKNQHIQDVLDTGFFTEAKICKILGNDETDGITYAIQYFCDSMADYNLYVAKHAKALQEDHNNRYKDQFVAFRTLMEVV